VSILESSVTCKRLLSGYSAPQDNLANSQPHIRGAGYGGGVLAAPKRHFYADPDQHPKSKVEQLTPRLWKEHFGSNPLLSPLELARKRNFAMAA
jgi:hypothetical protein